MISPSKDAFKNLWTMTYRHQMVPNITKTFYCEGDIRAARDRAMKHCAIMGYKFSNWVAPLVHDLDFEEKQQITKSSAGEVFADPPKESLPI